MQANTLIQITTFDNDPGRTLRLRQAHARPRDRQGARTRHAASRDEIKAAVAHLVAELSVASPRAVLDLVAILAGVNEVDVRHISIGGAPVDRSRSIHLDVDCGLLWTDLARVTIKDAASPDEPDAVIQASSWSPKPLPRALHQSLLAMPLPQIGDVVDLGSVFSAPLRGRGVSLISGRLGRMRPTLPRLQHGLVHELLSAGTDPLVTALALNQPQLVPRARLYYVSVDATTVARTCDALYQEFGLGPATTCEIPFASGSRVVPRDSAVTAAWSALRALSESLLPARRYTLEQVVAHHNAYSRAAGWLVAFLAGARKSVELDFRASSCKPGASYVVYSDKQTGPFGQPRPVLLGDEAQEQVRHYYAHVRSVVQRAERIQLKAPWVTHASDVLAHRNNHLFFRIEGAVAVPLGSADVMRDIPREFGLLPNSGRHYWQTAFHKAGLRSDIIDIYARHASRGTEAMTSTSALPLITAHESVREAQSETLRRLSVTPLKGLGRRSST